VFSNGLSLDLVGEMDDTGDEGRLGERVADEGLPARVVVAICPRRGQDGDEIVFKQALLETGRRAVLAFSTRAALVDTLGDYQPWLAIRLDGLRRVIEPLGVDVCLDGRFPDDTYQWTGEDLVAALEGRPEHP
jgi:hypothetical protein